MHDLVNLEKLEELRRLGKIDASEFEEHKRSLFKRSLRESGERGNPKSGVIYILLAWFLGAIGVHNFYAGYWGRAIIQLLLTLLAPFFLFVPLIVAALWVFAELLFQNRSCGGQRLNGSRKVIGMLRIGAVIWFVMAVVSAAFVEADLSLLLSAEDILPEDF